MRTIKVVILVLLILNVNNIFAQKAKGMFEKILKSGEIVSDAKTVDYNDLNILIVTIVDLPDLSKYDRVSASIFIDHNAGGFFNYSGKKFMSITENSTKTEGMKYVRLIIANPEKPEKFSYFTIDSYPFDPFDAPFLFSKEDCDNKDSYKLKLTFAGQYIDHYDEKWEDGKLRKIPVYGKAIYLMDDIYLTVETTDKVASKYKRKQEEDKKSFLDAINAGNKRVKELR